MSKTARPRFNPREEGGRTRECTVWLPVPCIRGSPLLAQLGRVRDTAPLEVT